MGARNQPLEFVRGRGHQGRGTASPAVPVFSVDKTLEQQLFDDIVGLIGRANAAPSDDDVAELRGEADRLWARLAVLLERDGRAHAIRSTRDRIVAAVAKRTHVAGN